MPSPIITMKQLIVAEIRAALAGISGVGGVVDIDAAALQQGERGQDWVQHIKKIVQAGNAAIEMDVSPSDNAQGGGGQDGKAYTGIDVWEFDVLLLVHLPEPLTEGVTPLETAEQIAAEIYAIAGRSEIDAGGGGGGGGGGGLQCGRWFWLNGTGHDGSPLAMFTTVGTMGGVALSDLGTRVTVVRMTVNHRTRRGRAEVRG